jgi:hypothetical protein
MGVLSVTAQPTKTSSERAKDNWENVKALAPGTEVLVAPNQPRNVKGEIEAVTDDSIVVKNGKGQETFRRGEIDWISVRVGRRKKHVLSGLKWGAVIGAGIGAAVTAICLASFGGDRECFLFIPGGALDAAGLGALFGAITPGGEWREIYRR